MRRGRIVSLIERRSSSVGFPSMGGKECVLTWPPARKGCLAIQVYRDSPRAPRGVVKVYSKWINLVELHRLLPPPLSVHRLSLPFALSAFLENGPGRHIHSNRLAPLFDVLRNGVHPALLQHVGRLRIRPNTERSLLRAMYACHPISSADMKPF
jgi:hypothetical protein